MAQTIDIDAIRKLSIEQRMALIDSIWATIGEADEPEVELSQAAATEMERRAAELRANPDSGLSHDEVKQWLKDKRWK